MAQSKELVAKADGTVAAFDSAQALKASKALLSHISKAAQEADSTSTKRNILNEGADDDELAADTPIWLNVTTKRHISDDARLKPGKIRLPHSLNDNEHTTVCLITADPQRAYKNIIADDEFPIELGKRITRVVDVTKLKAKFSRYEAQRKLFSEHDVFLADDRIVNRLPKLLGKTFFKTTQKRPVPVVISAKQPKSSKAKTGAAPKPKKNKAEGEFNAGTPADIATEIEKALSSALVALSPSTNTSIRVAFAGMTPEQVAANVEAVSTALVEKWVPQKWRNVKSIHIKGPTTAALPIWLTDELWLEQADVVGNDDPKALQATEKANVGKKRKSVGEPADAEVAKPSKKAKARPALLPDGNDEKLDAQIADRKARLRKQKTSAAKTMD